MSKDFDPYHVWLGIPANEHPPHHYRLLGIPLFEANPEVIESAADRQMQHLRTFQSGTHGVDSQRLLNEVSKAKICLLNLNQKQEYDQQLRLNLAPPPVAPAAPIAPAVRALLPQQAQPLPTVAPAGFVTPAAGPIVVVSSQAGGTLRGKAKKSSPVVAMGVCIVSIAALVLAIVVFKSNQPDQVAARPAPPATNHAPPATVPGATESPDTSRTADPAKSPNLHGDKTERKPLVEQPVEAPQVPEAPLPSTVPAPALAANTSTPLSIPKVESRKRLLPIPEEEALAAASGKVDAAHSDEVKAAKTQLQKRALAQTFLGRGLSETGDDVMRYALLRRTVDIANEAGSYDIAVKAIESLGERYAVDAMALREAALDYADRLAKSPAERRLAVDSWRELAKLAVTQDNYDLAVRSSQKAVNVARETQDKGLLKRMVDGLDDVKQIKAASADAIAARDALQENPKDPAAAVVWSKFCCLYKGDWDAGLPLLAAGSGDELCELARQDQRSSNVPAEQAQTGDKWWAAAATQTEPLPKKNVQGRAIFWYRRAVPWLADAAQAPLKDRIEKYDQLQSPFPLGEWVDVLSMIDPARHAVHGAWSRHGTELAAQRADQGRCTIPVTVSGSYDLDVRFTLARGFESNLLVRVGDRNCIVIVGGWDGRIAGLGLVNGKGANENDSTVRHTRLRAGQQQRLQCRVRPAGDQATIEVDLNSRPLIRWQGPISSLSRHAVLRMPDRQSLGLAMHQSDIVYHSVRLKLVSGKATPL